MELKKYKAVKALIQYKNKFLLLKKEDFIGGEYELPGGRKKPQENDESALKREVKVKISEEHSGYIWVPRENLSKYNLPSWLEDAIHQLKEVF